MPFPVVAAVGCSYVLFSPVVSGDWHSGNLRACLQDAVGMGLGGTACQGLTPGQERALWSCVFRAGVLTAPQGLGGPVGAPWCLRALLAMWW